MRERLKEARGIGTPAARAEIIGGLEAPEVLAAQGKRIVPTELGSTFFDVLRNADQALVGRAEIMDAIDAVSNFNRLHPAIW